MVVLMLAAALVACNSGGGGGSAGTTSNSTYTVTYNGNGNTSGSVPIDPNNYVSGQTVTVLGNTGTLVQTNYSFAGWNTQADGTGTIYAHGQAFTMGTANVTLYAKWVPNVYPISVTLASGGVSSQITATTGGSLTMSGPDGTQFTLSIPPNSLTSSTAISMTPVSSLTGLPLSNGVLEAVQLGPEGLQLQTPATLTVVFASPITVPSGLSLMGFNIQDTGADFAMISPSITGGQMIFSLEHFSVAGVAEANIQELINIFVQQYEGFVAQMNVITLCSGSNLMQETITAINLLALAQFIPPPPDLELLANNALGLLQYTIQQIFQAQNTECQTTGQDAESLACIKVGIFLDQVFPQYGENLFLNSKTCGIYSISINPPSAFLNVGDTQSFTATLKDKSGNELSGRAVSWWIDDYSIATFTTSAYPAQQTDVMALSSGATYVGVIDQIAADAGVAIQGATVNNALITVTAPTSTVPPPPPSSPQTSITISSISCAATSNIECSPGNECGICVCTPWDTITIQGTACNTGGGEGSFEFMNYRGPEFDEDVGGACSPSLDCGAWTWISNEPAGSICIPNPGCYQAPTEPECTNYVVTLLVELPFVPWGPGGEPSFPVQITIIGYPSPPSGEVQDTVMCPDTQCSQCPVTPCPAP